MNSHRMPFVRAQWFFESDGCDIPPFSSEVEYSAANRVSYEKKIYECKPPPDDTWCSRIGYEPGAGLYSDLAWEEVGPVTGPCAEENEDNDTNLIMGDHESIHFFCGLDYNSIVNDCAAAQHCPSGTDEECELPGALCFGGTTCDASKGHGEFFEYFSVPYHDARNRLYCAPGWTADWISYCTIENQCRDGLCDNSSCLQMDCNVQDLIRAQMEANGDGSGKTNILGVGDPKRSNFCGMTWEDASYQCGDWCPEGVECPEDQSCFSDTTCFYDEDLVPSPSPTRYQKPAPPPSVRPTRKPTLLPTPIPIVDNNTPNPTNAPTQWAIKWFEIETPKPLPVLEPTQTPTHQPSHITMAAERPTKHPTFPPIVGGDDPQKRYCGFDWADVIENCLTAIPCSGGFAFGVCPRGMNCIAETPCSDESYLDWLSHEQANNGSGEQAVVESKPKSSNDSNSQANSGSGEQALAMSKPGPSNDNKSCLSSRDCQTSRMKFCHQPDPGQWGHCGECLPNGMGCSVDEVCRTDGCQNSKMNAHGVAKCYTIWGLDRDCVMKSNDINAKCNLTKMECEAQIQAAEQETHTAISQPPLVNPNVGLDLVGVPLYQNPEGNSFFCGYIYTEISPKCLQSKPCPGGYASGNCAEKEGCFLVPSCRTQYESATVANMAPSPSKPPTLTARVAPLHITISEQSVSWDSPDGFQSAPTLAPRTAANHIPELDSWYDGPVSSTSPTCTALTWTFWFPLYIIVLG